LIGEVVEVVEFTNLVEFAEEGLPACTASGPYEAAVSTAATPMSARSARSPISLAMASASASGSSGATSRPSTPWVSTSEGPVGQSKLTTGSEWLIASIITIGSPSKRELST
jgi:hypothetical protein